MDPTLNYICLTLLLGFLPDSVAAKGDSTSSSRAIILIPASGGLGAYCRDQLTYVDRPFPAGTPTYHHLEMKWSTALSPKRTWIS